MRRPLTSITSILLSPVRFLPSKGFSDLFTFALLSSVFIGSTTATIGKVTQDKEKQVNNVNL
ncbi:MAG: hypothetical protein MJK15_14950 [Colwellia sp.]|nr:hypothetical protein [Colwellia sp.]